MIGVVAVRIAAYGALGALIGMAYFAALAWNVRLYTGQALGWNAPLLHLARLGVAVAAFALCARQGAAPMLASFAGFFAIRVISVNHYRSASPRNS
jgi:F1F0 ATPase subunit 2